MTAVALLLGLLIDHIVGEPRRWHPLVGFGNTASKLEQTANPSSAADGKLRGLLCWMLLVLIPASAVAVLVAQLSGLALLVVNCLLVSFLVVLILLAYHLRYVSSPLLARFLDSARLQISLMFTPVTSSLSSHHFSSATS